MKPSKSQFLKIRGLKYHIREWGNPGGKPLIMLHGWMDVSASFQFAVDALSRDWHVFSPDWRGFGLTEWAKTDYWFQDYVADLSIIVDNIVPNKPISIVGHSMGGNIAGIFSGIKPQRIEKLILAEGFGVRPSLVSQIPEQYKKWLDCIATPKRLKQYASFSDVAKRIMENTPTINPQHADFLATHWARKTSSGKIELRADPKHKHPKPSILRPTEAIACWQKISAPVLWIYSDSDWLKKFMKNRLDIVDSHKKAFENLTEITLDKSSHMMHLDRPRDFAEAIENFLAN